MLCHLEKESNYERRGCNGITAAPLCHRRQPGCREGVGCSLHQHRPFIGPVRFLKRTRGQKTPCRQDCAAARGCPEAGGGVGGRPPTSCALPQCAPSPSAGRAFGAHSGFRASGQPWMAVTLCPCRLEKPQWLGCGIRLPSFQWLCCVCSVRTLIVLTSQDNSFFI